MEQLEPNTTVGRLHINHDNHRRKDFNEYIRKELRNSVNLPSGYSLIEGEGGWFPEDHEDEIEPKSILEVWIDSQKELEAVRSLKEVLEEKFDQECVCLELRKTRIEHDQDEEEE